MLKSLWWWVGVKTWILVLSFKPKLNNNTFAKVLLERKTKWSSLYLVCSLNLAHCKNNSSKNGPKGQVYRALHISKLKTNFILNSCRKIQIGKEWKTAEESNSIKTFIFFSIRKNLIIWALWQTFLSLQYLYILWSKYWVIGSCVCPFSNSLIFYVDWMGPLTIIILEKFLQKWFYPIW